MSKDVKKFFLQYYVAKDKILQGGDTMNNNQLEFKYKVIGFIIFIGIIVVLYNLMFSDSDSSSKDYKIDAYVMSQDFIKDYLTSPSTARFPTYSAIKVIQTNNRYKVEAYVDSQNSFGASIRTKYYMILERSDDGGWTKISCDIK